MQQARYRNQVKLAEVGIEGQEKLARAKVLVIGAGGLGCPVLSYLAAAGIGTLGIMDFDVVDETNLHRQPLYTTKDVGKFKAEIAADYLQKLNPLISIKPILEKLSPENALEIIPEYDLIIDATDNFPTRYLINDACIISKKPWIFASIQAWEGQVSVFNYKNGPTYRCLFPAPPSIEDAPNCNENGVIGTLPAVIGSFQANEAVKCILGKGENLSGRLLVVDLLQNQFLKLSVNRNETEVAKITSLSSENYSALCSVKQIPNIQDAIEITATQLAGKTENFVLIDIREEYEFEENGLNNFCINIPYQQLISQSELIENNKTYIFICEKGKTSRELVKHFRQKLGKENVWSLSGGIEALKMI